MRRRILALCTAAFSAVFLSLAQPAAQSARCMTHDDIVAFLAERFGERVIGVGLIGDIAFLEIFASASGTWTVVTTDMRKVSCMILAGSGFSTLKPIEPGKPEGKPS